MKTKVNTISPSRKIILFAAMILASLSTTANTLETTPVKEGMFVFYLTAVLFFAVYFIYVKLFRTQKNVQPVNRTKHYHYRKVIKRTA